MKKISPSLRQGIAESTTQDAARDLEKHLNSGNPCRDENPFAFSTHAKALHAIALGGTQGDLPVSSNLHSSGASELKKPTAPPPKSTQAKAADAPETPVRAVKIEEPVQAAKSADPLTGKAAAVKPLPATKPSPAPTQANPKAPEKPAKPVSAGTPTQPKAIQQKAATPKSARATKAKSADTLDIPVPVKKIELPEQSAPTAKPTSGTKAPIEPPPATVASPAPLSAEPAEPQKAAKPVSAVPSNTPKATQQKASSSQLPSQATINQMVEEAAYYLAEQRNFAPGFGRRGLADGQAANHGAIRGCQ